MLARFLRARIWWERGFDKDALSRWTHKQWQEPRERRWEEGKSTGAAFPKSMLGGGGGLEGAGGLRRQRTGQCRSPAELTPGTMPLSLRVRARGVGRCAVTPDFQFLRHFHFWPHPSSHTGSMIR